MNWSEKSKWIWLKGEQKEDSYGEFYTTFCYESGEMHMQLSADSNYVLYINGVFVNSGQYPDFPHYKIYDKLDITEYCQKGENKIAILVWYYGIVGTSTYYKGNAAIRFEVYSECALCAYSDEKILSRLSIAYKNGLKQYISPQLGLSFHYDATVQDNWITGNLVSFQESREVYQNLPLRERPIEKLVIDKRIEPVLVKQEKNYYLYDLGREEVGYLTLRVKSQSKQKLTICYGEHIADSKIRWKNEDEGFDFRLFITVGDGVTEYTNYFRRLGLRYLEVWTEEELEVDYISVCPCFYPLKKVEKHFDNEVQQHIYDVSVRTLELCLHDHYEDCPWREQALYAMDSRNQMLCGYYAFDEYRFARENLYLMSKDNRRDGLLSICTPSDFNLTIPSFSLHYFTEVCEYTKYSGDKSLATEVLPKLQSIMEVFLSRMKDGLVSTIVGTDYWNFYEWTEGLSDSFPLVKNYESGLEAALNCLLSIALQNMQQICDMLGVEVDYGKKIEDLNEQIRKVFYQEKKGLYINRYGEERYSELVNALAILCGAAKGQEAEKICEILVSKHNITKASLSMMCFKYDALLKTDKEKYRFYVLDDIEKKYTVMLEAGATSFWETEDGEADFYGTGSLCHGWSAMPVYYYHTL